EDEKEFFQMLADRAKEIHGELYPNYKYKPAKSRKNRFIVENQPNRKKGIRKAKKAAATYHMTEKSAAIDCHLADETDFTAKTPALTLYSPSSDTLSPIASPISSIDN